MARPNWTALRTASLLSHWQRSGLSRADVGDVRVRLIAEPVWGWAEDFRPGIQLGMDLKSNDRFPEVVGQVFHMSLSHY